MRNLIRPFESFFKNESAGGIALFVSAALAIVWANSPFGNVYDALFSAPVRIGIGSLGITEPLGLWINDGLMALFFYLVGLEIKRELTTGELNSFRKAALPVAGALGGMILPVILFVLFNFNTEHLKGWAIPMATDIAFAMAIIRLLGSRVSRSVIVFLTALAIVDDLGAVLVIALFYTAHINLYMLALAMLVMLVLLFMNREKVSSLSLYLLVGILLWLCLFEAGIHPTLAGVITGFFTPGKSRKPGHESPLHKAEKVLLPYVNFLVIPVFGLANSGIMINPGLIRDMITQPLALGIILGLFAGKQFGISFASYVAVRLKIAQLPENSNWRQVYGASILGGIGFTMSIFIADLALGESAYLPMAKLAIIVGSLLSSLIGAGYLLAGKPVKAKSKENETGVG